MNIDRHRISYQIFIWTSFWVVCMLRTVCMKFKIPLHTCIYATLCGFLAAFVVHSLDIKRHFRPTTHLYYLDVLFFYLPGSIFNLAFHLDNYVFMRTLAQILVISLPVSLATAACTGLLFRVVIHPSWPHTHAIMFGIICSQLLSSYTTRHLQRLALHMKHTSTLLDGESLISNINCYLAFILVSGFASGALVQWHHYVLISLRLVLMGSLSGYLIGLFGRFLIRTMYTDQTSVVMIIIAMPFFNFGFTEIYLGGCGTLSVMILGLMMNKERAMLTAESDNIISDFWTALEVLITVFLCLHAGFINAYFCIYDYISKIHLAFTLIIYVMYSAARFFSFLLFSPLISRLGYGMDVKSMIICVFGGLKHPLCLLFSGLYSRRIRYHDITFQDVTCFKFYVFGLYFLSYLINGAFIPLLLKVMGVSEVSMAKQVNMNNCMKHIFAKRDRAIAVLKMDRYVNDADWLLIQDATAMRHPDKVDSTADDDDFYSGYRLTYCPDCKKDVVEEPTKKELKEMSKEAKMRVLKAMKMSYARQYENGMISKEGIRILNQAVELAMDSEDAVIVIDGLHRRFNEESCFKGFIRKRIQKLSHKPEIEIKAPKSYWRRVCYRLVKKMWFNHTMHFLNFVHVVVVISFTAVSITHMKFHLTKNKSHHADSVTVVDHVFDALKIFLYVAFLFEFWVRWMAFSRNGYQHGLKLYFKSPWNTMDFIVLALLQIDIFMLIIGALGSVWERNNFMFWLYMVINMLKLIRVIKLIQILRVYYPTIIRRLDTNVDTNMAFTYELGKAYVSGVDEVQKMLPQIIDHEKIRDQLNQRMDQDKVQITKLLGMVQKERPWIAITVKTKQVIRTVNNSMKENIMHLKTSGWTDQMEHDKLMKSLAEVYKQVNSIKSVQPSAPEVIFKEVSWMAGDQPVYEFLFENVTVKKYDPGEIVFGEGMVADGIYVVVTGLFQLNYKPDSTALHSLEQYGQLPIADYVLPTEYYNEVSDYIVSGNCMGELSILTGRSYNCTITADSHSQVYVLNNNVIRRAMELSGDFVTGLQCRIWKSVSIRLAVPILMTVPAYQTLTQDQIKYDLERAFMPDLVNFKIFAVTEMIQDIILIEGLVGDFHTRETYSAPCYIPRTVQKLILPKSSLINVPIDIDVKLLIIPEKEVDEIDVMLLAEETCELVAQSSSLKCLQHTIQNRRSRLRRRNKMLSGDKSSSHRRRRGDASSSTMSANSLDETHSLYKATSYASSTSERAMNASFFEVEVKTHKMSERDMFRN